MPGVEGHRGPMPLTSGSFPAWCCDPTVSCQATHCNYHACVTQSPSTHSFPRLLVLSWASLGTVGRVGPPQVFTVPAPPHAWHSEPSVKVTDCPREHLGASPWERCCDVGVNLTATAPLVSPQRRKGPISRHPPAGSPAGPWRLEGCDRGPQSPLLCSGENASDTCPPPGWWRPVRDCEGGC